MRIKKTVLAAFRVVATNARFLCGKVAHGGKFKYGFCTCLALSDTIALSRGASIDFGDLMHTRGGCSFNVQESGCLVFGRGVFLNRGCMFNCHKFIEVGDGCEFGPSVLIYDHDHDFRKHGLKDSEFECSDVRIGRNCWIGAGSIILRGTILGDECVVGAGSVIKGVYPARSLIVQKRKSEVRGI